MDSSLFQTLDGVFEEDYDVGRQSPGVRTEILEGLLFGAALSDDALGFLLDRHLKLGVELDHQFQNFSPFSKLQLLISFPIHQHCLFRRDMERLLLLFFNKSFYMLTRFIDRR